MRIGDFLYFAPNIKFSQVDFSDDVIGNQYKERIDGYYLSPAKLLAENNHAFASGLLLLCCMDSLSLLCFPACKNDRERYKKWVQQKLISFQDEATAFQLYDLFRNGLVHNSSLKKGMEFSLHQKTTLVSKGAILTINPAKLLKEVADALNDYINLVNTNTNVRKYLVATLKKEFSYELTN